MRVDIVSLVKDIDSFLREFALKLAQLEDPHLTKSEGTYQDKLIRGTLERIFALIIPILELFSEDKEMRKEIITCDRCKEPAPDFMIARGRDLCAKHYKKYLELNTWFDDEMEKWLYEEKSALDNV